MDFFGRGVDSNSIEKRCRLRVCCLGVMWCGLRGKVCKRAVHVAGFGLFLVIQVVSLHADWLLVCRQAFCFLCWIHAHSAKAPRLGMLRPPSLQ